MRMRFRVVCLALLAAVSWVLTADAQRGRPPAATPAPTRPGGKLALVGGMLLTGYEVPPIHHATVLIEGNKIVAAGPSNDVKVPADATVVDTSGRTMLPGLIEAHGHLVVLGHGAYEMVSVGQQPRRRRDADAGDGDLGEATADGGGHDDDRSRRSARGEPEDSRSHQQG